MDETTLEIGGIRVPRFLYGTAWKEEHTQELAELALKQGFRGIDTANQRKHYHEVGVGKAIATVLGQGVLKREDLFLQTKYTFARGQDHRLPYDPQASIPIQVAQSLASSLEHLGTTWLDSYVLHGPTYREGLTAEDWQAWRQMEALHGSGQTRLLGVSNVSLGQLQALCAKAHVPPAFVQNRCYASQGWDRAIRDYCRTQGIVYQGFSLLTANREALSHPTVGRVARRYGRSVTQVIFRFALDVGMIPLTGTSNPAHMAEDLDIFGFRLEPAEVAQIEALFSP